MQRDFTFIDDIVYGTAAAIDRESDFEIFNLGNHKPEEILKMIQIIEDYTGQKAIIENLPMPKGEIQITYADITKANDLLGFVPTTSLEMGMEKFLNWYCPTIVSN